ncbi:hypothetical protein BpHYR1_003601 [Brachionus plicatilis]|uniref:Uncharacterized protein n=1 Tax=Brachionus plicatilis TaxID=10195 RepID=A0A3M7PBS0_BRAPC|nr:hypothetical protein BpHYR1_003601 [Brachionus plicatilis]
MLTMIGLKHEPVEPYGSILIVCESNDEATILYSPGERVPFILADKPPTLGLSSLHEIRSFDCISLQLASVIAKRVSILFTPSAPIIFTSKYISVPSGIVNG